jgi:hypothetical protein
MYVWHRRAVEVSPKEARHISMQTRAFGKSAMFYTSVVPMGIVLHNERDLETTHIYFGSNHEFFL